MSSKQYRSVLALVSVLLVSMATVVAQSSTGMKFRSGSTLEVTFLSQDPDPVEPGSYVDLRWKVENLGTEELQDVQFMLETEYPFSLNDPKDQTKQLGDVGIQQSGDEAIILHWRIRVDENALEGDNEVRLSYFIDDVGVKLSPFKINIKNKQALLAVEAITLDPQNPSAGQLVNVSIRLHNVVDTSVEDVNVKLDLTDMPLATVGSTNERVIQRIAGEDTVTIPFTLAVDANADAKVHQVPLRIDYANRFGDTFTLNSTFGLRVASAADYLMNLEETEVYTTETKGKVTLSVSNVGKSDLNFVTVELDPTDDYRVLSAPQSYIGNLESDDFETAEFTVYVLKTKATSVELQGNLRFKDAYNDERVEPFTLPLRIYRKGEAKDMGLTASSGIGGVLVALLIVVLLIVQWRRGWKEIRWISSKLRKPDFPIEHPEKRKR